MGGRDSSRALMIRLMVLLEKHTGIADDSGDVFAIPVNLPV